MACHPGKLDIEMSEFDENLRTFNALLQRSSLGLREDFLMPLSRGCKGARILRLLIGFILPALGFLRPAIPDTSERKPMYDENTVLQQRVSKAPKVAT